MVYCNTPQDNTVPTGITSLISCLSTKGHDVSLFHTTFYKQDGMSSTELRADSLQFKQCEVSYEEGDLFDSFVAETNSFKPDVIGFSVFEVTFNLFKEMLKSIQPYIDETGSKIAVGGIQALFWPESIAKIPAVDFISTFEAETTFPELCSRIENGEDYYDIPGYWLRNDTDWTINRSEQMVDIEQLPPMDPTPFGERFMMKPMMGKLRKTITIEVSRGCPYKCTYCADATLTEKFKDIGKWHRIKSVPALEKEYSDLIAKFNPEFIYKFSETFLATSRKWFNEYCDMYSKFNIPFWTESRPETMTDANIRRLADINCTRLSIGLESGNYEYRKTMLKRGHTDEKAVESCKLLKKYGISFSMNLIIGFPFETREMIWDGIRLLRECQPDSVSAFIFTPYKGSKLREVCVENDMIDPDIVCGDYFQDRYLLRNNIFTRDNLVGLRRAIPLYIYLPESRYPLIEQTEILDENGDKIFKKLKEEFYEIRGW
jgi:anaerobic magnesium-protoporphyrin IX monomethyl ester cyclase